MARTGQARYWAQVDTSGPGGCWLWRGRVDKRGYGRAGGAELAHRRSYRLLVGTVPEGLVLDHLCRVPLCVNPAHLEPVTQLENMRRAAASQTHCKSGHEFTPENTYLWSRRPGRVERTCRACNRTAARKSAARRAQRASLVTEATR